MRKHAPIEFEEFASDVFRGQEHDFVEVPLSGKTFFYFGLAAFVLIAGMLVRVGALSLGNGDGYAQRAAGNIDREKLIPAHRGVITDRNGKVLAKNAETFSVYVHASEILKRKEKLGAIVSQISEATGVSVDEIDRTIATTNYEKTVEVALVRNISAEAAIAIKGLEIPGVNVENDFRREYPNGSVFSAVVGYTGTGDGGAIIGKTGLELFYDNELKGVDGAIVVRRDAKGSTIDEHLRADAKPGKTLTTTIDGGLQEFFYNRLAEGIRFLGVHSGVGIALDPRTGEVLSLVSFPSYDNNIFMTPGTSKQRVALFNDKNLPLFNRAVAGAYNPGSTIKPLVAVAGLREGVITPTTSIYSKGYIEIPNPYVPEKPARFVEFNQKELGWIDVRSALAESSNIFFASIGGGWPPINGIGIEKLRGYWAAFGLGAKTGIDAKPEAGGFLPNPAEKLERTGQPWRLGDTFNASIGQGDLLISPLQLINYIAGIANGGVIYRPHLMKALAGEARTPEVLVDVSEWQGEIVQAQRGMRDGVVKSYGTSNLLHTLPISVAAKTGSAQIQNNRKTNAFFVGYAPYEKPELAVLVLIEDAKSGSLNAVPIAKDVFAWYYENRMNKEKESN